MKIALAGNPNSGKTSIFNLLTGKNEKVGNWAGVTVDKKEYHLKKRYAGQRRDICVVDLPGAYSMSAFTGEEKITGDFIKKERPDAIINIVDATSLRRSLFFTTQLLELGIPVVVALNKSDINDKRQTEIDEEKLSEMLKCPVIKTSSRRGRGLFELVSAAVAAVGKRQEAPYRDTGVDLNDKTAVKLADKARFDFVSKIVGKVERRSCAKKRTLADRVDSVLTDKYFGLPIFAVVMALVFMISQSGPTVWLADLISSGLERAQGGLASLINSDGVITSILIDGIIGGFIAIVGFLPLIMVMYFLIALLEDCGYMARAAVVLEPIMKKVGLNGKSVIAFIMGTGCAIPGVMASRTVKDERERRTTAMLAPFMPCGAKLPVIALFAGSFFESSAFIGALMYFLGILVILLSALVVNAVTGSKRKSYFIIELPDYKRPGIKKAFRTTLERGWSFIVKAGTIILLCNFAVHLMQTYTPTLSVAASADESILAFVAMPFAYLLAPITGKVSWQLASASITGFIAKENVVSTLAVSFGIVDTGAGAEVVSALGISSASALAFLMFNLFTPPCFAAIGAMRLELKSKRWLFGAIGLQIGMGYSIGFLAYFIGTLLTGARLASAWVIILGFSVFTLYVLSVTYLIFKVGGKNRVR